MQMTGVRFPVTARNRDMAAHADRSRVPGDLVASLDRPGSRSKGRSKPTLPYKGAGVFRLEPGVKPPPAALAHSAEHHPPTVKAAGAEPAGCSNRSLHVIQFSGRKGERYVVKREQLH